MRSNFPECGGTGSSGFTVEGATHGGFFLDGFNREGGGSPRGHQGKVQIYWALMRNVGFSTFFSLDRKNRNGVTTFERGFAHGSESFPASVGIALGRAVGD
jgi:hypothetical protein